jgi:hypothetical protein
MENGRLVVDRCHIEVPVRIPGVEGINCGMNLDRVPCLGALVAICLDIMFAIRGMAFHSVCDILWGAMEL